MLIRFTVENFLSFNERVDFNMIASPDTKHPHHVVKDENDPESIGVLKTSLIYGANASGKSNLVKAMDFAQRLIVDGVDKNKNIPIARFKLDKDCSTKPSRFEFEFKSEGRQYAYGFVVDESTVYEEWLFEIGITLENTIFTRENSEKYYFNLEHNLLKNISKQEEERLHYESESTRKNLLFLTNCEERNISFFKKIYAWFNEALVIVFSQEDFFSIEKLLLTIPYFEIQVFNSILQSFDLGIAKLDTQKIDLDDDRDISDRIKDEIKRVFPYDENNSIFIPRINVIVNSQENELKNTRKLIITRIKIIKEDKSGNPVQFEISEESDGTRRLISLLPMIFGLYYLNVVYIFDEIEKSLHSLLLQKIFELILQKNDLNSKSQFIATTHNVHLLDVKNLFRKDEIWFAEKDRYGQTTLYSLANTNVDDLDWETGYLNGRFGAIPFIKDSRLLGWTQEKNQDA